MRGNALHELRRVIRSLRVVPAFTVPALFSLAFGVGLGISVLGLFRLESIWPPRVSSLITLDQIRSAGWTETWGWPMRTPAQIQSERLESVLLTLVTVCVLGLIIAGLNFLILLMRRASARRRENAIRYALGASGRQLLTTPLVEGAVLGAAGGGLGILAGVAGAGLLRASWPHAVGLARGFDLFPWIILFGLAATIVGPVASLLFNRVFSRLSDLIGPLTAGARATADRPEGLLRDTFVIAQLAASIMLLVGSGLLIRDSLPLTTMTAISADPEDTLTVQLDLSANSYPGERERAELYESLLERLDFAGVEGRALSTPGTWVALAPVGFVSAQCGNCYQGGLYAPISVAPVRHHGVSPGFFRALGVRVAEGREFSSADGPGAPRVAVVNRTFAARYFEDGRPLGRWVQVAGAGGDTYTVVGVVDDKAARETPALYLPIFQSPPRSVDLALLTSSRPDELATAVARVLSETGEALGAGEISTLQVRLARHASPLRWLGIVLALLGASALILAVSGLYSVMRYIASQRRREIGIHMALGARGSTITRMILRYSLKLSLIGGALGLWGALILVGTLRKFSPDLPLFDPPVYLGVLLLLAAAGTLGAYGPARSAAHIEPSEALRAQ